MPVRTGPLRAALLAASLFAWPPAIALAQQAPSPAAAPATLTLAQALARAASANPGRAAVEARMQAAEAATRQAGVRPNPSIGLDLENALGTGPYSLLDRAEATVSYQQTWERGGKREARVGQARAGIELARLHGEVQRLDYLRDVQVAYANAVAAEAELLIAEARYILAVQSQANVDVRVKSARDPLFAGARAETLTSQAGIARDQARTAALSARLALAALWGGGADFTLNLEPFFLASAVARPTPNDTQPDLALLAAERDVALATVKLEQARAVADPTVKVGARYLGDGSALALVVGGTIPLQRHDRNQGNIDRAHAERNAAEADIAMARATRDREIARLVARLNAAAQEAESIRAEVIPAALKTIDLVTDGFNRGGFQFADVSEAQRALAEARARRVQVLHAYHLDKAALDRLTGLHAAIPTSPSTAETR